MWTKYASLFAAALALAGCHEGEHGHDHAHGDLSQAAAGLHLDDGKKWRTDESLRSGMTAIRNEVQSAIEPIHAKTYPPEDYSALAGRIDMQIGIIAQKCKLPKQVDDQLHLVLAQISNGAATMRKDGDRMAGAVTVIRALESYAKYFDHQGWNPIAH